MSTYLVRELDSCSSEGSRDWEIQPERLNYQTKKVGKTCISVKSKRVGFERLHSLELKFISLVGLMNREK